MRGSSIPYFSYSSYGDNAVSFLRTKLCPSTLDAYPILEIYFSYSPIALYNMWILSQLNKIPQLNTALDSHQLTLFGMRIGFFLYRSNNSLCIYCCMYVTLFFFYLSEAN